MHELTVAIQIRRGLETELASDEGTLVADVVRVQVGALSGIVPEALQFAWPHAVADSATLGSARLDIDWVDVQLLCVACNDVYTLTEFRSLRCPHCRSPDVEIIAGDELDIASVDVRERARDLS
ncbi:MAG: hydrogenase maturation nickel metallochaperone HypA [Actinobacteria bacterium]|jgi:hydrogenase nickel incorporation protein HypA/HybF|nr:hydrogenase maturation nickel metallochaperone HypA [Actinomycetota bacterium]